MMLLQASASYQPLVPGDISDAQWQLQTVRTKAQDFIDREDATWVPRRHGQTLRQCEGQTPCVHARSSQQTAVPTQSASHFALSPAPRAPPHLRTARGQAPLR